MSAIKRHHPPSQYTGPSAHPANTLSAERVEKRLQIEQEQDPATVLANTATAIQENVPMKLLGDEKAKAKPIKKTPLSDDAVRAMEAAIRRANSRESKR